LGFDHTLTLLSTAGSERAFKLITFFFFFFIPSFFLVPSGSPCDRIFRSDVDGKNGTFTSPGYPSMYGASVNCNYEFRGSGRERVQIVFTDFILHHPHDDPNE